MMLTVQVLIAAAALTMRPQAAAPAVAVADPAPKSSPTPPAERMSDIVVTGRRDGKTKSLSAVDYYRRYCFDANRRTGRSLPPNEDSGWTSLDPDSRTKFGVANDVPAFGLYDEARGQTLLLKIERFERPNDLVESRCTLVVVGGTDHGSLASGMSGVFGTGGTQRHVGATDGSPRIPGWRQRLWTGMPARRSKSWKAVGGSDRTSTDTWVVVSGPHFYDDHDYVMGDLKTRITPGTPLSVLSFAYITRSRPK